SIEKCSQEGWVEHLSFWLQQRQTDKMRKWTLPRYFFGNSNRSILGIKNIALLWFNTTCHLLVFLLRNPLYVTPINFGLMNICNSKKWHAIVYIRRRQMHAISNLQA